MLECKVLFHNNSHLQLGKAQNGSSEFTHGQFQEVLLTVGQNSLKFFKEKDQKEPFCSVSPLRMNVELDRNANSLSLLYDGEQYPTLEIKSDILTLEKIEKYIAKRSKVSYKGNLCYTPANRVRETIFTTTETNTNLRGFLNLALLALIFAKFRDIIVNFLQTGIELRASIEMSFTLKEIGLFTLSIFLPMIFVWRIEKMGLQKKLPNRLVDILENINIVGLMVTPIVLCNILKPKPLPGIFYVGISLGMMMKLYSYSDVMNTLRKTIPKIIQLEKENKDVISVIGEHELSRENLEIILKNKDDPSKLASLKDLLYFLSVPIYCYQLWYPRNPKIRWDFLIKRIVENTICWALFALVLNQYVMPIMDESVDILQKGSILEIIERVIRLSFPLQVCWILFFFGTFQYLSNIAAEIQRFADRQFYKDWWNCRDLNEYWRLWNLPIHEFFTRHVYFPMLRKGYSKEVSKLFVFFVSAVGHEYWASVPLRLVAFWAFLLMLVQLPIMLIELKLDKLLKGSQLGNIGFWISFCFVGQPMALLMYYQLYLGEHGGK